MDISKQHRYFGVSMGRFPWMCFTTWCNSFDWTNQGANSLQGKEAMREYCGSQVENLGHLARRLVYEENRVIVFKYGSPTLQRPIPSPRITSRSYRLKDVELWHNMDDLDGGDCDMPQAPSGDCDLPQAPQDGRSSSCEGGTSSAERSQGSMLVFIFNSICSKRLDRTLQTSMFLMFSSRHVKGGYKWLHPLT